MLRELFPNVNLHAEDLLLLEPFQISYLPDRVAHKEFASLLREYPVVRRFLVSRHPPIKSFLNQLLKEHQPAAMDQVNELCEEAIWEIADLIIYNKHPELYDQLTRIHWDLSAITSITALEGLTVADVGAGSGRIAFLVAPFAKTVFAIEPISGFRTFMKEKATNREVKNLYIMDGTLDAIPLPDNTLDVLITSNAIGWNLVEELKEIERVVKPGGKAIHLLQSEIQEDDTLFDTLTSASWNYKMTRELSEKAMKLRYYKTIRS